VFVSQTHLPQLLDASHYVDPAFHELEVERLFLPGWHCVAVWDQFPHDGDYLTIEILGRPLILWRTGNAIRAFLNVCAHRFCMLTDKARGRFGDRIKCQYHGWEYDATGNTCKIPDAQNFRPLTKGELGLKEYHVDLVGQLVFVTLNDDAPPLRGYLGPDLVELCERRFSRNHRITRIADMPTPCNWKLVLENMLDAYHIECVHPKTFKYSPPSEHCTHTFHDTYDYYIHDYQDEPASANAERLLCKVTGQPLDLKWRHILRYPNIAVGGSGPWYYMEMIWPETPTTCRILVFTLHDPGRRGRVFTFLMHRLLMRLGSAVAAQVQREDAGIFAAIQHGTSAPDRPYGGGLISAREERIFAFQKFVLRETGCELSEVR